MQTQIFRIVISLVVAAAIAAGGIAMFRKTTLGKVAPGGAAAGPGGAAGGAPPPPEVSFVTVEAATIPEPFQFLGMVEASRVAEVRSRVKGFLAERMFEEGAFVEEGAVLYRIERATFEMDVSVARARVNEADTQLKLKEKELARLRSLVKANAAAVEELDRTQAERDQAEATLALRKAEFDKTETTLGYTEVHAPQAGIVGKSIRDVGALVDEGENSLLTIISRVSPVYVTFGVSEQQYLKQRAEVAGGGLTPPAGERSFELRLQDGSIYSEAGLLNFESPGFEAHTGMLQSRVEFANAQRLLKPGQFAQVFETGWTRPNSILIPKRAVSQSPAGSSVLTIDEKNVVHSRAVTMGEWVGEDWRVISGLKVGDRVVVDGAMKARPESKVVPVAHVKTRPPATEADKAAAEAGGASQ